MSTETYQPTLSPIPGVGPDRRGNPFARVKLATGLLAVIVVGAVGLAMYDGADSPTVTSPAETVAEPAAPAVIRPGDTVGTIGGGWLTYPNGLAIQVSTAAEYPLPGQSANDTLYSTGLVVTVSVKNGTGKAVDASWANVTLTYGPFDQSARPTYDRYQGRKLPGMFFDGVLAPGATNTTRFGFSVPVEYVPDLTVAIRPGIMTEPAVFAGGLAAHPTPTPSPTPTPTPEDTLL